MNNLAELALKRLAEVVITTSSGRGLNPTKPEQTSIRNQLRLIDLEELSDFSTNPSNFPKWLNAQTIAVKSTFLPRKKFGEYPHYGWGYARKFANLFLAEAARNYMLRERYHLDKIERILEIPLDSHVADALSDASACGCTGSANLPEWSFIYKLAQNDSDDFQKFALDIANRRDCARHDLDLLFWRRASISNCPICNKTIKN
ncbi:hypothetical protein [Burkholderia pseudomallei]|uniref:hypothetical protein n=1 Tax=Burkholderia pseudomallei TaxID=28450 RepID=UPI00168B875A|nr:hypothetical protein [Burkholderia pseudomallei]MBD2956674.1 hypothetical protein [Burkholderia pseudomallei]MBD2974903.1 hypothetical protein [Burkholderia pseudomallei]MBF3693474.1 hypothetical protein [Burkholderia pseudomallei]